MSPSATSQPFTEIDFFDSHCHAWSRWPYSPAVPDERTRGAVELLLHEMDVNGVGSALVVCAAIEKNADNVEYVSRALRAHNKRLRMVPDLDCVWSESYHAPGSAARLQHLAERHPIVGFAHYTAEDNDGFLRSDEADELFSLAGELGLIVSLGAFPSWQADLRELASIVPIGFARDFGRDSRSSAGKGRGAAAGEAGDRQVEATPENMHGAALA